MALNESEYELVTFIEQEYLLSGSIPSKEICLEKLSLSAKKYDALWKRDDFRTALMSRGISQKILDGTEHNGVLTTKQMLAVNTLLDINDTRSDTKKLRDLGIPTQTYQGWQRDPAFRAYLHQRTELLFGDALTEANRALYDNVKRGDLGSMKQLWEMTGRWSSKPVAEMNIEWVLMKVIEVIQRHVTEPAQLSAIAADLSAVQAEAVPSVQPMAALPGLPGRPTTSPLITEPPSLPNDSSNDKPVFSL